MVGYPKVRFVEALEDKVLLVQFDNGETRFYDCKPLLSEDAFALLASDALFRAVKADRHGYGVVWSDEIDLSESELWLNGTRQPQPSAR